jgi:hypothetical protein
MPPETAISLPTDPPRKNLALIVAGGLLLLGMAVPLLGYFLFYRPARTDYDAKADEVEQQLISIGEARSTWAIVGRTMLDAGELDLANTAIDELHDQNAKSTELKEGLRRSAERRKLESASGMFRSMYAIGVALIVVGVAMGTVAFLQPRKGTIMVACALGGAIVGGLAGYLWWNAGSPLDRTFGVGEIALPGLIAGGLAGAAGAWVARILSAIDGAKGSPTVAIL